jgi:alginate O-acetyltransferase complex protein AlgI
VFLASVLVRATVKNVTVRQWALLIGSYVLYLTWTKWFAIVLVVSTLANYAFGKWLGKGPIWPRLSVGIAFNVGLLGALKYLPELAPSSWLSHWVLPLGLSFWTFQAMSYLFDQYRGEELDPSLVEFALYMAFFPVTIAGPVCRMPDMLPQFRAQTRGGPQERERGFSRVAMGVLMMQVGKMLGQGILAGGGINTGFDRLQHWGGADVWCLSVGFGLQLFFDFAGYSHIAIGAAQMMGITVPENFDHPFASETASIFWTRWHMSLSFWIRDYVFLPLAMMSRSVFWRNVVLVLSMVLFGLWHKASLLFVLWGFYHGVLLVAHRQLQQLQKKFDWIPPEPLWKAVSWCVTMALVSLGWILFRANSLRQAQQMLFAVVTLKSYPQQYLSGTLYLLVVGLALGYAVVVWIAGLLRGYTNGAEAPTGGVASLLARKRWYWLPALYVLVLAMVLMVTLTQSATTVQFMYRAF